MEFDSVEALDEFIMICYFWKSLKPSIKIKMEQQVQALASFKEMVQKAINAEVKASLKSNTMVWDSDIHYFRSYCPSHNISLKVQTQSSKDFSILKNPNPRIQS